MHLVRLARVTRRLSRGSCSALLALALSLAAFDASAVSVDMSDILGGGEAPLQGALDLLRAGQPGEAEAAASAVIRESPDSAAAHEVLGVALALQDRVADAIEALHRAIELNPQQYTAWTKLGDIAQAMGDEEKALSFYRKALGIAPDARMANQRVGLYLARHGETASAIRHLEKGLVGTPDNYLGVRVDLAGLYVRSGQPERALEVLARWEDAAARGEPVRPAALVALGEALLATGRPDAAAERFRGAVEANADDVAALLGLGRAERALGHLRDSVETLTRAVQAAPDDPAAQIELVTSEAAAGQRDAAETRLDRLVATDAQPAAPTLAAAARLYGAMAFYGKARESFSRAIAERPDDPALRAGMTIALLRLGDTAGALEQSRKRLELAPDDADAAFMVGMLEDDAGDRTGAVASYRRALTNAPEHWRALNNLAAIRLDEGRTEDALALARRAAKAAPDNPTVLDTLAQVYEARGDDDRLAETRLRLGNAYLAANRTEDARKAFEQAAAAATDPALRARIEAQLKAL